MMWLVRRLSLPLLAALAACNLAISDKPLLTEADRSAVRLKDGYWAIAEQDCRFDAAQPVDGWPKCADWVVIAGNQIVRERDKNVFGVEPALLIADGKPLIMQVFSKSENGGTPFYTFAAIEPTTITASGQTAAMDVWIVECRPDPSRATPGVPAVGQYPGFDDDCRPDSIDALRNAAAAGRPHQDEMIVARWVRAADGGGD